MIRENDIKDKIAQVISHEISISGLADWVYSNSWNMHQDSSPSAVSLASNLHLLLAERDDLSLDDAAFLRELVALSNVRVANISDAPPPMVYSFRYSEPFVLVPVRA